MDVSFFRRCFPSAAAEGRPGILGILNATPDSFSDGGANASPEAATARARYLLSTGADALDIGAESTRPGFVPVGPEEQLRRLLPVLRAVRAEFPSVAISVDTRSAEVAAAALAEGADVVNDQGGLSDPDMAAIVARTGAGVVAMHGFAEHCGLRSRAAEPGGLGKWVAEGLREIAGRAAASGIAPESLCLDPGYGFGLKKLDNLEVLSSTAALAAAAAPCPLLVGPSRKHFLPLLYPGAASPDEATALFCAESVRLGARILRVHEPGPTVAALRAATPPLVRLESTGSTNDDATALARDGAPDGACVAAGTQTAGRGRAGHSWLSPPGVSLCFSVLFRPSLAPDRLPLATLALGVAVADAVSETCGLRVLVKWPNDILANGRKCGGILCEADLSAPGGPVVVAGVGLDVNNGPDELPARPIFPATSLKAETGREIPADSVLAACRSSMSRWMRILEAPGGPEAVMSRLSALDILRGRAVDVALPDGSTLSGTACGIDREGRLRVAGAGGNATAVLAGSVSLAGRDGLQAQPRPADRHGRAAAEGDRSA